MPTYELARCAVCGSAESRTIAAPADIRAEAEALWAYHMRRLSPDIPPERLVDRVAFTQEPPWRVVHCDGCGLVYRSPAEKREQLRAIYTEEAPGRDALQALHDAQRDVYRTQAHRLTKQLDRRGSGLEVGSYVGAFLSAAREHHWQFEGLDVNAGVNAFTRSLGFTVHDGDLESARLERTYDAVAIWNTFDQLPDPRATLLSARRLLAEGGVLALRVPNGACYARWRGHATGSRSPIRAFAVALLAQNNLLTFPYRFGFTPRSLTRLLFECGFAVRRVVGDVLVPTADEWTRPWARLEERALKRLTRPWMPWFEVYASPRSPGLPYAPPP